METYGKILLIAMPAFLVLILLEKWWGIRKGNDTIRTMDMVSSLTSGITNSTKDVLGLSIAVLSYDWMVTHWAIFQVEASVLLYIIAFVALDLTGYLVHRIDHEFNFFWNAHIIHHSSEDFNLACALRQSISTFVRLFTIFLLPAAILGVPTQVIAVVAPLHLFAQFWYHTQHIDRMGWLEKIIVTPSHHRVHHAINQEYLDKNYGQIFIFWDKWFGTYQEELSHVKPVYGITRPVRTWNPIKINFMHLWLLIQDAWRANSLKDKLRIWFMPTGWRPADVAEKYPVFKIEDPYHFEKYETKAGSFFTVWVWVQLGLLLLFISYLFGNIAAIGSPGMFYYGLFIFVFVYAFTELMDGNPNAWAWEFIKFGMGIYFLINTNGWFGLGTIAPIMPYIVGIYLLISLALTFYFKKENNRYEIAIK
ncbi:sterol desaturase family protein [Sediminibacterium sp.]|uniref:sterol desaturase family protein n=1 Tax=Sediminibacterium sp. TaxID=1917865 RepID=UPI0027376479|nr:sterol desaturase family protein [Sediminibacterium sp.]MDP3392842.1 sterol desaturase family protein [Sediminibacterium sp.]MDP3565964.1 sterol desaturase family protein [Sediminibacterium sp.]